MAVLWLPVVPWLLSLSVETPIVRVPLFVFNAKCVGYAESNWLAVGKTPRKAQDPRQVSKISLWKWCPRWS